MLTHAQGGRNNPLKGGLSYRPNHNFWPDSEQPQFCTGFIELPAEQTFTPGMPTVVEIKFFAWPELKAELYPGRAWRIQEASKIVGYGKILQVLE